MVAFDKFLTAEDSAAGQLTTEVLHVGQGVPVRGGGVVEPPVVAAGRQEPSDFFYHVEW